MKLFEKFSIRGVTTRNRIWVSPMCQYSCEQQDGVPSNWHLVHLGSRAVGGAGLVMAEAAAVAPEGRITPWDAGIWSENQADAWREITSFIKQAGAASAIQLAHAGRKASSHREWSGVGSVSLSEGGWQTVSATDVAFGPYEAPRRLSETEIGELVQTFAAAAKRAVDCGFDLVEIHAAHGYLIHQFLSPISNDRTDRYGGSLENRARFLLEIVRAVRGSIPEEMPLLIRFSATDYVEDGWDVEQTSQVAKWAADLGADLFDISSGGLILGPKIPTGPGYQVPLAEQISEGTGLSVSTVGQITQPQQAADILETGKVDVVMIGRVSLRDPYWPLRAAAELGVEVDYFPKQYRRGAWPKD